MESNWIQVPFPEVIDFQEGPGILAKDFRQSGIPLVRLAGMERGASVLAGCNYLDPELVAKRWMHFALKKGDVLLSTSASLGRIAVVRDDSVGAIPYTGIIRMRPRDDRLVGSFVRYLLEGPDFQRQAEIVGVGSVIRHFGPMHLRQMTVTLPPRNEQQAIVCILESLDEKIELSRRMNETLEAMARALFESWFVTFDPVHAKAGDCENVLIGNFAKLFPDAFEDSELGKIPYGWRVQRIDSLAEIVGGSTPSTKEPSYWKEGRHHWVTPKDLSTLSIPVLLDTERRITDAGLSQISSGLLPTGTVLLSSRAPIGYLAVAEVPVAINQGFIAMKSKSGISNLFLLLWSDSSHDEIVSRANGSTFLEISKSNFRPIPIAVPTADIMKAFDGLVRPLYERMVANARECATLTALRNMLLPKLISGELRVKEAAKTAEAACA
jgi:type I restriction enzyme, S subunit